VYAWSPSCGVRQLQHSWSSVSCRQGVFNSESLEDIEFTTSAYSKFVSRILRSSCFICPVERCFRRSHSVCSVSAGLAFWPCESCAVAVTSQYAIYKHVHVLERAVAGSYTCCSSWQSSDVSPVSFVRRHSLF
jgi:hypothetical protein